MIKLAQRTKLAIHKCTWVATCLLQPKEAEHRLGRISVDGVDVSEESAWVRKGVGEHGMEVQDNTRGGG